MIYMKKPKQSKMGNGNLDHEYETPEVQSTTTQEPTISERNYLEKHTSSF